MTDPSTGRPTDAVDGTSKPAPSAQPGGAMWGGRFAAGPSALFRAINDSLPIDWRLVSHEIDAARAWATALVGAGVLTERERDQLHTALAEVATEASEIAAPPVESGAEDVHTWVEQRLVDKLGPLGKKLHTGKSRNDHVATDLRLWSRDAVTDCDARLASVQHTLVTLAERESATPFPAFTHLQPAQPITFGHWCGAFVEMLARDRTRLARALETADECPLGAAALAGTAYPIDRHALARELGFARPCANSLDAVADRDLLVDLLNALALCGIHLSRMAEDLIVYLSMGLIALGDDATSGSSIMPQKKNPDALELVRGKSAAFIGFQQRAMVMLKGLPTAYNKDLQDDKATIFEAFDLMELVLGAASVSLASLSVNHAAARAAARAGHANATDLADHLVRHGTPFRDAHEQVGKLVRLAIDKGVGLEELSIDEIHAIAPNAQRSVFDELTIEAGLAIRSSFGGTAPERVAERVEHWKNRLAQGARPTPDASPFTPGPSPRPTPRSAVTP